MTSKAIWSSTLALEKRLLLHLLLAGIAINGKQNRLQPRVLLLDLAPCRVGEVFDKMLLGDQADLSRTELISHFPGLAVRLLPRGHPPDLFVGNRASPCPGWHGATKPAT
jgi:hypothetical protein